MDDIHNNYDAVFKDALTLFKDKTLDFLGLHGIAPIDEPLPTENVQVDMLLEYQDLAFGLKDSRGLNIEEEVDLSKDDLLRIGGYNLHASRIYKREFLTVIFVKEPTKLTELLTEQICFKPIIVQCSQINADEILERLRTAISAGKPINELELIYLPLFKSLKYTPTELFVESTKLVKNMRAEVKYKQKIGALVLTLGIKVVDEQILDEFAREVSAMDNPVLSYFKKLYLKEGREEGLEEGREKGLEQGIEQGMEQGIEQGLKQGKALADIIYARKMISKGLDEVFISELTGISPERLREIRDEVKAEAV